MWPLVLVRANENPTVYLEYEILENNEISFWTDKDSNLLNFCLLAGHAFISGWKQDLLDKCARCVKQLLARRK